MLGLLVTEVSKSPWLDSLWLDFNMNYSIEPSEPDIESPDQKFVNKVKKLIEHNMENSAFDAKTLCKELTMPLWQVNRRLKLLTGKNTTQVIRYMRLYRAKQYLEKNAYNVTESSYKVGIVNISYFSKLFKREFSVTPSAVYQQRNNSK